MTLTHDLRPTDFDQIIEQQDVVRDLKNIITRCKLTGDRLPDMLLAGPPGCGKTTLAICTARAYFGEDNWRNRFEEMNASDNRKIDDVRTKIKPLSGFKGQRVLLLDEAEMLTDESQNALRRIMENSVGTTFILTANRPWQIIEPIQSRCVLFSLRQLTPEGVRKVIMNAIKVKGIKVDVAPEERRSFTEGFEALLKESGGDVRKALNILEKVLTDSNTITIQSVMSNAPPNLIPQVIQKAISGEYDKAREMLEDAIILSKYNVAEIIMQFDAAIKSEINDKELKARLLLELARTEDRLRRGGNPLIQFGGFLGFVFISPHLQGVVNKNV